MVCKPQTLGSPLYGNNGLMNSKILKEKIKHLISNSRLRYKAIFVIQLPSSYNPLRVNISKEWIILIIRRLRNVKGDAFVVELQDRPTLCCDAVKLRFTLVDQRSSFCWSENMHSKGLNLSIHSAAASLTTRTAVAEQQQPCVDELQNCHEIVRFCNNDRYSHLTKYCKKSCKACGPTSSTER